MPKNVTIDMDEALQAVHPRVVDALEGVHAALLKVGAPHLLIGGLAVGAYGYHYATQDVDLLVSDSWLLGDLVKTLAPGMPYHVGGVRIDYMVPPMDAPFRSEMEALLSSEGTGKEIGIIPLHLLVYLKLRAGRAKDRAAVVELIHANGPGDFEDMIELFDQNGAAKERRLLDECIEKALEEHS